MAEPKGPRKGGPRPGAMTVAMQAVKPADTGPKVLRIGMIRDGRIVEERIIRKRESVSVGTSEKNHFLVRAEGFPSRFDLFQLVGGSYILNFTDTMSGRVGLTGGVQELEHLRQTGGARHAGTHYQIKLNDSSRGRVVIGDTTFLFQFVLAPPVTPRPQLPAAVRGGFVKSIDWLFTVSIVFTYMLFFGFIIVLETADWPVEQNLAALPENVARLVFEAPPPPPEPPSAEAPAATEEAPVEAPEEAKPAKKPEKHPGKKPAEKPAEKPAGSANEAEKGATKESGGAEEAAAQAEARARIGREAAAQAESLVLGALSDGEGSALGDVLKNGAVTSDAASVLAQARGVGVAKAGSGGAIRQRGGGGSGSGQGKGLGSLANASGAGRAVAEGGAVKEREIRGDIRIQTGGDIGGAGEFDANLVKEQIQRRIRAIKSCYEQELRRNPALAGKVTVEFTVQERGNVTDAKATENSTGSDAVAACVTRTIARFRFNPGPEGGSVTFRYPFVFQPSD